MRIDYKLLNLFDELEETRKCVSCTQIKPLSCFDTGRNKCKDCRREKHILTNKK